MAKIGRYEVEAEIGRGAMGVVHLARDPRLRRRVAVKTYALPGGLSTADKREVHSRFLREAQAAARLSHPGIVTVYDVDEDPESQAPFIAMEYVNGCSLRALLDGGKRIGSKRAIALADHLADALGAAHAAGIVHRDLKPANILIRAGDGTAKIADFGVARLIDSGLTRPGSSFGSPAYMSPEQFRGRDVDPRSDLFSLAVILYESLCGVRPFQGDDMAALGYAVVHETPVPATRLAPDLPVGLDGFFDRALAKDPEARPPTAAAFRAELRQALENNTAQRMDATVVDAPPAVPSQEPSDRDKATPCHPDAGPGTRPGGAGPQRSRLRRRPLMTGVALLFLLAGAGAFLSGSETAYLRLDARNAVESGELFIEIDGEVAYRRELAAPQRDGGFLRKMLESQTETFEAWIEIPPGKHEITARVVKDAATPQLRDAIVVDLEPGEKRDLRIIVGRMVGRSLTMKLD